MYRTIHGHTVRPKDGSKRIHSKEYNSWGGMKDRCYNEDHIRYHRYGGRGIKVCERWLTGGFAVFLKDMGEKPSPEHSLERKDHDGDYSPENCCWASPTEQARNKSSTRWVEIDNQTMSLAEAVERFSSVAYTTVRMRIQRGWSELDAIYGKKS